MASTGGARADGEFELVIKDGLVVDPSQRLNGRVDVGFRGGKVAAIGPSLPVGPATEVLDATDRIVTPGLIDIHAHFYYGLISMALDSRTAFLPAGVTTAVDAGTAGANNLVGFREFILDPSPLHLYGFLNIGRIGFAARGDYRFIPGVNPLDLAVVDSAVKVISRHRDRLVGVKLMLPSKGSPHVGLSEELLARSVDVAEQTGTRVMCHLDGGADLRMVMGRLRAGDIVTHCFQGKDPTIIGADGHIRPEVKEARERGVLFDIAPADFHHISWGVARAATGDGFFPDLIGTDLAIPVRGDPPFATVPECISMMVALGMDLESGIAAATSGAADAIGLDDAHGSLAVGRPGDAAILESVKGSFTCRGMVEGEELVEEERLRAVATVLAGRSAWKKVD